MMADEDRLTKRDIVRDLGDGFACALCVGHALFAIVLEAVRALLGAIHQARILVADLAGELGQQILGFRRPGRLDEKLLPRCPFEAGGFYARVFLSVEAVSGIQTKLVVVGRIGCGMLHVCCSFSHCAQSRGDAFCSGPAESRQREISRSRGARRRSRG
ncbi:hypothetical protein [Bradyrhizobium barranii]